MEVSLLEFRIMRIKTRALPFRLFWPFADKTSFY